MLWLSDNPEHTADVRVILEEYVRLPDAWERRGGVPERLPPHFEQELADLPGNAAPPHGDVAMAVVDDRIVAAGLVVPFDAGRCEFKRVYVRPEQRRSGVATQLVQAMLARAASLSYSAVVLEVMPERIAAVQLWESLGFLPCPPYRDYGFPMDFMTRTI
jgi:GNAT superfamily N-acetyltransferase